MVGFEGGAWHTHPDLIAFWLGVPEGNAIRSFIDRVMRDELAIITSVNGGKTFDPQVTDDLSSTFDAFGRANCLVRYWSGKPHLH